MKAGLSTSFMSPIDERTGLIRWVFELPIQPGEPKIFNVSVKMADTVRYMSVPCYDNNGGSGLTREAARGAAIGEGLERYCVAVYDAASLLFGTAHDLSQDHPVYPPNKFALFHPDQQGKFPHFTEDTPIAWVWGYSLMHHEPVLVPACLVYMPYFPYFREQGEKVIGPAVSTGLACARSYEEALLKSIYESVERDAFTITWLNCLPIPQVDIASNAALNELYIDRLQRDGLNYVLLDMTTDISIPSFLCILIDERRSPPMICAGGATNFDPVLAASKALVETVQTREWAKFLGGNKVFNFASDFSDIRNFDDHVALYAYGDMLQAVQFLIANRDVSTKTCWKNDVRRDPVTDLKKAVATLAKNDLDIIALDLTTPDVAECGYCVTKILAPQLHPLDAEHSQRFLGGSRLYQVPHRLGFTPTDTTLEQLNPYPHPYP